MNVQHLFENFRNKKILVIGDVMLDRYMIGNVQRISPEAPVPVVELSKEEDRLGGAANVALNIISLGAKVVLASVVGDDEYGKRIIDLCSQNKIESKTILQLKSRPTTVKTRILGNKQQLLRVDYETKEYLDEEEENLFLNHILSSITNEFDAVIFEDYNKGLLTEKIIQELIAACQKNNIATTVDPKLKNFFAYKGVTLFKPNLKELREGTGNSINFPAEKSSFESALNLLNEQLNNTYTFVTLSENGVAITDHNSIDYIDAHIRNISDVSGAGDTVIAVATLCLCSGCSMKEIAQISNLAGGLVCEKTGVVSIEANELIEEVEKLFNLNLVKE
jgi:rfaE bifunctional protein kinase chain/domain